MTEKIEKSLNKAKELINMEFEVSNYHKLRLTHLVEEIYSCINEQTQSALAEKDAEIKELKEYINYLETTE